MLLKCLYEMHSSDIFSKFIKKKILYFIILIIFFLCINSKVKHITAFEMPIDVTQLSLLTGCITECFPVNYD